MRIYLADGTDPEAALQAALQAGHGTCSIHHSDGLGSYVEAACIGLEQQVDLLAAIRAVDPAAGTTAFWMYDVSCPPG